MHAGDEMQIAQLFQHRLGQGDAGLIIAPASSWIFDGFGGNKTEDAMNFWRGLPIEGRKIDLRVLARMKLIHIGGGNPGIYRPDSTIRHDLQTGFPRRNPSADFCLATSVDYPASAPPHHASPLFHVPAYVLVSLFLPLLFPLLHFPPSL